ncbi:EAL domain-containing protein [Escherichia coli]
MAPRQRNHDRHQARRIYVAYQPVVDTQALRVTGLEVLLRWRHPVAGEIPRMPSLTLPNRKR